LSTGLVAADKILSAFDAATFPYYLLGFALDTKERLVATGTLTLLVQAKREDIWQFLGDLNIHLAARAKQAADPSEQLRIVNVNISLY